MDFLNDGGEVVPEEEKRKEPPRRVDAALAVEALRLEFVKNFGSNTLQKTEITNRQRQLLPMLMNMSDNMFPVSSKVVIKGGKTTIVTSEVLKRNLALWVELGIPVNRKGRDEELRALMAILGEPKDEPENKTIKNRLLG